MHRRARPRPDGFEGEEKKVADAVEKLRTAGETGDAGKICDDVFSKQLREEIAEAGSTCEQEMEKAIDDADDFELDVEDVTIDGDDGDGEGQGPDRRRGARRATSGSCARARAGGVDEPSAGAVAAARCPYWRS